MHLSREGFRKHQGAKLVSEFIVTSTYLLLEYMYQLYCSFGMIIIIYPNTENHLYMYLIYLLPTNIANGFVVQLFQPTFRVNVQVSLFP